MLALPLNRWTGSELSEPDERTGAGQVLTDAPMPTPIIPPELTVRQVSEGNAALAESCAECRWCFLSGLSLSIYIVRIVCVILIVYSVYFCL